MRSANESSRRPRQAPELFVFGVALAVLNFPLLTGGIFESALFSPAAVKAGEWWRVPAHPFVHLSWYHLLLDAGAFLLLYVGLDEPSRWRRLLWVIGCGLGSLALSTLTTPLIAVRGLCGLSGIAHGLMAVSALECMTGERGDRKSFITGMVCFGIVVPKSIVEVLQGHVFFEFLHFGLMGSPVPACHAGGVLSGILMFLAMGGARRIKDASRTARASIVIDRGAKEGAGDARNTDRCTGVMKLRLRLDGGTKPCLPRGGPFRRRPPGTRFQGNVEKREDGGQPSARVPGEILYEETPMPFPRK